LTKAHLESFRLLGAFFLFSSQSKPIGELAFVLSLEDWGPIGTQNIVVGQTESTTVSAVCL